MTLKWKTNIDGSLTLPKGEYYIGDLCYVQKLSAVWDDFCTAFFDDYAGHAKVDGIEFFANSTAYGDEEYTGTDGSDYPVDAGLIGIISAKHLTAEDLAEDYINVTKFDKPFNVSAEKGVFYFGHITIDTLHKDTEDGEEDF